MSSKQRVFSHDNTINYIEYLKNKNGEVALKTIKNSNNYLIRNYKSYEQKINYSKAFYKHYFCQIDDGNCEPCSEITQINANTQINSLKNYCVNQPTNNLYKSNISYKKFETLNDPCKKCISKTDYPCNECRLKNHTLYPYATYKGVKNESLHLTKTLNLDCWYPCAIECPKPFQIINKLKYNCDAIFKRQNGKIIKPLFIN